MPLPQIFDDSESVDVESGAPTATPLDCRVPEQRKEEWCWAAVTAGIHEFYEHESIDQCRIASQIIGIECCPDNNACNEPRFLKVVLNDLGYEEAIEDQVDFDVIREQIEMQRPLCCFIDFGTDIGHFIIITACDADSKRVGVIDPAKNQPHDTPRMITYQSFRLTYNDGTWRETYLTRPRSA